MGSVHDSGNTAPEGWEIDAAKRMRRMGADARTATLTDLPPWPAPGGSGTQVVVVPAPLIDAMKKKP